MNPDPLQGLLDQLCRGDDAAAQEVFRAYEPYLRVVVRKMLPPRMRAKFDSVDVVQSVWADVLHGFREAGWRFDSPAQLRAFLVKATRNRFIDRVRRHRRAAEKEQPLETDARPCEVAGREATPSEVARAGELWQRMLDLCPPAHREVLRLKRQGSSLAEIAAHTGLHPSSVRRILYELARRLAFDERQAVSAPDLTS